MPERDSSSAEAAMSARQRPGALALLGGRLGTHSAVYGAASAVTVLASLANVAVITRFLSPGEYGELAVLLFFSAMVTIVVNLGSLQGTFAWAFAGGGAGDDDLEVTPADAKAAPDRRRAYMTGIAVTAAAGALALLIVVPLSPWIADVLVGRTSDAELVTLAVSAAGALAVWRLTVNCLRLARRPAAYLASTAFLNVGTLAITTALLAGSATIGAVLAAQALGAAVAVALNLGLARANLRWAVDLADAREILRRGRPMIPVVLSFQTVMLADVFLLSRTLSAADVGLYRVASRVGSVVSHVSSAFLMAWGGLRRDPLHHAADATREGRTDAALTTYYTVLVAGSILAVGVLADALVRIAGPAYRGAADLIPLTALAFGFHGWYVVAYRSARFAGKRRWFISLSVLIACVFVGLTLLLVDALDAYAAPVAAVAAWSLGIGILGARGVRSGVAVPMASRRVAGAVLIAGACYAIDRAVVDPSSTRGALQGSWVLVLYPTLLVALGVIPRADLAAGVAVLRDMLAGSRRAHRGTLAELDPADRALVVRCLAGREPRAVVADDLGLTTEAAGLRLVGALRRAGGLGAPQPLDGRVAGYLLDEQTFVERDEAGRQLVIDGVDARELDALRRVASRLAHDARLSRT